MLQPTLSRTQIIKFIIRQSANKINLHIISASTDLYFLRPIKTLLKFHNFIHTFIISVYVFSNSKSWISKYKDWMLLLSSNIQSHLFSFTAESSHAPRSLPPDCEYYSLFLPTPSNHALLTHPSHSPLPASA